MGIRAGNRFILHFHLSGIDGVKIEQLCNNDVSHIILHRATAPDNPLHKHRYMANGHTDGTLHTVKPLVKEAKHLHRI